jgi:hypothetical protein
MMPSLLIIRFLYAAISDKLSSQNIFIALTRLIISLISMYVLLEFSLCLRQSIELNFSDA